MLSGELSSASEVVASLLLVVQVASSSVVAVLVARRLAPRDRLVGALLVVLLVLAQAVAVPLALGMVGLLRLPTVVIGHLVVVGLVVRWERGRGEETGGGDGRPAGAWGAAEVLAVGTSCAYLVLGAYLSVTGGRSRDFDTQEYHLANLAEWVQRGHIWGLPFASVGSVTSTHPGNGELFAAWLALPTHGDELLYLVPTAFALLTILAVAVAVRELAGGEPWAAPVGALTAVAVLAAPIYFNQVDSLLTDIVAAGSLLAGVALLLVARREGATSMVVLAGIALGLGLGSKYTAIVPTAAVVVAAAVLLRSVRRSLWLAPGLAALSVPWFLRNLLATGNPLFPQDLKVVGGGETPYNVLNTTILHHLVHWEGDVIDTWSRLGRDLIGPVLLLVGAGLVLGAMGKPPAPDRTATRVFTGLAALTVLGYLITPVTGGGPTGLAFIIASCFRYALVAVLLAAAVGIARLGPRFGGVLLTGVLVWDLWQLERHGASGRSGLLGADSPAPVAALTVGAAIAAGTWFAVRRGGVRVSRSSLPLLAAASAVVSLGATFAAVHHNDRGRTPTALEATALAFGADRPAVVLGAADLRAILGPRLERPLVGVSRGGRADEIPFADDAQLRRRVLGEDTAPPPPTFASELDAAIDATGVELLIVGAASPVGYPDGWVPDDGWCLVGGDSDGVLFVRPSLLGPDATCATVPPA